MAWGPDVLIESFCDLSSASRSDLWPLLANLLFSLSADPLQHHHSVFSHDLPVSLVPFFLAFTICFGILSLFALLICPYHLILSDFANFTVSAPCRISCISLRLLVLRLHSYFM